MLGPDFLDELDFDVCGDLFDHIDDFLNFPMEDIEVGIVGAGCDDLKCVWPDPPVVGADCDDLKCVWPDAPVVGADCDDLKCVWPDPPDAFDGSSTVLSHSTSELLPELPVPLEGPSDMMEHSLSIGTLTIEKENNSDDNNNCNGDSHQFQISSPVSVLDSSSSCSGGKTMPLSPETAVRSRSRSKRPRPACYNPRSVTPVISPTSSTECSPPFSTSLENFAESQPITKISKSIPTEHNKKQKRKLSPLPGAVELSSTPQPMAVRKCLHCEITKTPQWRMGPMGPKTLCNACGVRYKSGRLFPQYRPAASPTFVSSLHSNSHRKVLEMRNKVGQKMEANANCSSTHT